MSIVCGGDRRALAGPAYSIPGQRGAIGIAPCQLGTLLWRELEGVGKDPHKLLLWLAVPVEVLGYHLPAHLVAGSVFEVSGNVVRSPDGAVARQVVQQLPQLTVRLALACHARWNQGPASSRHKKNRLPLSGSRLRCWLRSSL
jgi:hypothetical protein